MPKSREFKNVEGVSLFRDVKRCYPSIRGEPVLHGIEKCEIVETRNADVSYSRDMPSVSIINFEKPVSCHFNPKHGLLFCGTYKVK